MRCEIPSTKWVYMAYLGHLKRLSRFCNGFIFKLFLCGLFLGLASLPARAQRPLGTDVSGYQPSINWTNVKNAGVSFAWAKATEGSGFTSGSFVTQETYARQAGIYIGAYHFARPNINPNLTGTNSADTEAQYFWSVAHNYVQYGGSYLVPMLDW